MAVKQSGRKVYKSMQGKQVDMDLLRQRNELTPAVGNARVNARGDELGPGGKIIRKREDVLKDYYKENAKGMPVEEVPAKETVEVKTEVQPKNKAQEKVSEDWVEDEDGNFVKRGE